LDIAATVVLPEVADVVMVAVFCTNEDGKDALPLPCLTEPTVSVLMVPPWFADDASLDSDEP